MGKFKAEHINATPADLQGNRGIGRYIFMPGSDGRAQTIAKYFDHLKVKSHPRGHHLYLGEIQRAQQKIQVAAISSGMGCPSMEIILHELFHLGAKRFLRIGTAGSLQPWIKVGAMINVLGSVRDESTTLDYAPLGMPAISSYECVNAILQAAKVLRLSNRVYTGTVHCKSSLFAREFGVGPSAVFNKAQLKVLENCGVIASEMETAALLIQGQIYNYQLHSKKQKVIYGALLNIVSAKSQVKIHATDDKFLKLAIETIKQLASWDLHASPIKNL